MSRRSQLALVIAACFLTGLVIVGYFISQQMGHRGKLTSGDTTTYLFLFGFIAFKLIMVLAAILFIIQGFRVHWGWGLANIFMFPLGGIAFFLTHRREGKIPMLVWAFGMALLVFVLVCGSIGI
jgi:hypothetical protein